MLAVLGGLPIVNSMARTAILLATEGFAMKWKRLALRTSGMARDAIGGGLAGADA